MKIKLNAENKYHLEILTSLTQELPEIAISTKKRKWGKERPSFKYKNQLYEFQTVRELMEQARKILSLTDKDYEKNVAKRKTQEPKESEELLLEIPVEKYNLNDLHIKLRLGGHAEKSSTYESPQQTLHYEKEPLEEDLDEEILEEHPEILLSSTNNDIILDLPRASYNLNDLKLNIKFTQYGEENSTYEVKKQEALQSTSLEPVDAPMEEAKEATKES